MSDGGSPEAMLYQQSVQARMEGLKIRVEQLRDENTTLKLQASKGETDTHEFVAYFQTETEKKDGIIAHQAERVASLEELIIQNEKSLRESYETQFSKLQFDHESLKVQFEDETRSLKAELDVLSEYKQMRDQLNLQLENAEKLFSEEVEKHQVEMNKMERKIIEERARIQRDTENRIEEIRRESRQEAQEGLGADTRKIIADNQRIGEELKFQLQTSDELQGQVKQLKLDNKQLRIDLSIANDKETEYASQGFYKENDLQTAREKIDTLERSLAQLVRQFEKAKEQSEIENRKWKEDAELEVSGLRQLVKLKNKELKNLRELSQIILDQRTEVEQYFLEALDQVKKEAKISQEETFKKDVRDYRKQVRLAQFCSDGNVSFPPIKSANQLTNRSCRGRENTMKKGSKIELGDLSWEERERVLRMLFAKINSVSGSSNDGLQSVLSESIRSEKSIRYDSEPLLIEYGSSGRNESS